MELGESVCGQKIENLDNRGSSVVNMFKNLGKWFFLFWVLNIDLSGNEAVMTPVKQVTMAYL